MYRHAIMNWTIMDDNAGQTKAESPSQIFCERVTVAGLEDLYSAKFLSIRFLFAVGLVMATMFGLLTSYRIGEDSLGEKASVNIQFKDDGDMLLPNVTICTSALSNMTAARELLLVPEEVEEKLKNVGAHRNKIIEEVLLFLSGSLISDRFNQSHLRYIDAIVTATSAMLNSDGRAVSEILRHIMPPCNLTLSNCTYDENPMDCCDGTVPGVNADYVCYGLPLSLMHRETKPFSLPIVFNVDVRMDWAHIPLVRSGDAMDGFLVIVSQPYTTTNTAPVAVAPGWHGTVKLTRIRRMTDNTDCVSNNKLPKLNYASYYDQDGKNCELELGLDMLRIGLQCTVAVATYFPNTAEGCSFQQGYIAQQGAHGAFDDMNLPPSMNHKYIEMITNAYHNRMGSMTKRCKPTCQRWQYEPIVGCSELRDSYSRTTDTNANISWSRITVIIPSEYYEEHMEEERTSVYATMCNVGGAMGVCLGLSAVTRMQVEHTACTVATYSRVIGKRFNRAEDVSWKIGSETHLCYLLRISCDFWFLVDKCM